MSASDAVIAVAWVVIASQSLLLSILVRRHGGLLERQQGLRGRLVILERRTRELARQTGIRSRGVEAESPYLYEYDPAGAPLLVEQPGASRRPGAPILGGLVPGSAAPSFALPDLAGRERTLQEFLGQPLLVIFFDPRSRFCARLMAALGHLPGGAPLVLLISRGAPEEHRRLAAGHGWRAEVLLDQNREVFTRYRARGTPNGYLLDAEGRLASSLAIGTDEVLRLAAMDAAVGPDSYRQVLTAESWLEGMPADGEQQARSSGVGFLVAASIFSGAMQELQQRWQQEKSEQAPAEPSAPGGQEQAA